MSDRPIIFSAPMIRALLDGRKTQTRRLLPLAHPKRTHHNQIRMDVLTYDPLRPKVWYWDGIHDRVGASYPLPYAPGARLWVRETWNQSGMGWRSPGYGLGRMHYRADPDHGWQDYWGKWRPSIHMPRWASRLTLTVTEVRVQRVQDISEADAMAEGIVPVTRRFPPFQGCPNQLRERTIYEWSGGWSVRAADAYAVLWNNIHGPAAWDANPWVAAISFTVRKGNIDV